MCRTILHCDMNNFYASVECFKNPKLKPYPVAVCGEVEERHGIVLAKNYKAKAYGVATGEAIWQAKQKCPDLVIVPPHYDEYMSFSKAAREIYEHYTDQVEPFGMDECWLDCTGSTGIMGSGEKIANEIRERIKFELGLTISAGVSFNKIFAKLGSDMKKPDAITEITEDSFKRLVWPLPCSELLYCGRQTTIQLEKLSVRTIGELAALPLDYVERKFGKNGHALWLFANGLDDSQVAHKDHYEAPKSIGHGVTCVENLENYDEANKVIVSLCQDIGFKLRKAHLCATGVSLTVKDKNLVCQSFQVKLPNPTQDELIISKASYKLLLENYKFRESIKAITVTATGLKDEDAPLQTMLLYDYDADEKRSRLNSALDDIKSTFGKEIIKPAVILDESKMPKNTQKDAVLPGMMHK